MQGAQPNTGNAFNIPEQKDYASDAVATFGSQAGAAVANAVGQIGYQLNFLDRDINKVFQAKHLVEWRNNVEALVNSDEYKASPNIGYARHIELNAQAANRLPLSERGLFMQEANKEAERSHTNQVRSNAKELSATANKIKYDAINSKEQAMLNSIGADTTDDELTHRVSSHIEDFTGAFPEYPDTVRDAELHRVANAALDHRAAARLLSGLDDEYTKLTSGNPVRAAAIGKIVDQRLSSTSMPYLVTKKLNAYKAKQRADDLIKELDSLPLESARTRWKSDIKRNEDPLVVSNMTRVARLRAWETGGSAKASQNALAREAYYAMVYSGAISQTQVDADVASGAVPYGALAGASRAVTAINKSFTETSNEVVNRRKQFEGTATLKSIDARPQIQPGSGVTYDDYIMSNAYYTRITSLRDRLRNVNREQGLELVASEFSQIEKEKRVYDEMLRRKRELKAKERSGPLSKLIHGSITKDEKRELERLINAQRADVLVPPENKPDTTP